MKSSIVVGLFLVKTQACGVCHTDVHAADGDWPAKQHLPFTPGHEGIGLVVALGAGVTAVKEGDRVGGSWLFRSRTGRADRCSRSPAPATARRRISPEVWGVAWAGGSDEMPPEPLDAAIIFATVGDLVPLALKAVRKGGRVVCAGIHMSDIPSFPYRLLWAERQLLSVANLTRQDAVDFLGAVPQIGIVTRTTRYPLREANQALEDLRAGRFDGAAVLVP